MVKMWQIKVHGNVRKMQIRRKGRVNMGIKMQITMIAHEVNVGVKLRFSVGFKTKFNLGGNARVMVELIYES